MFESKQNMSNVWRGITENTKHLCDGAQVAVGNGCKTLFWDHRWVSKKPLREYALHSIPDALNGATVEEMWNKETYSWKWSCLADLLPPNIIKEIDAYELKDDPNMGDLCYWGGSTNGKFSIKSAMQLIRRDDIEPIDKKWEAVWKVRVQQRIKMFVWLAMHDRVMGNTNRVKRQLTLDPRCTHCGAQEETTLHILRGCTRAKEVWRCVGGPTRTPTFWSGGLEHWLYNNLTYKAQNNQQSEIWPTYFAITLWWIWNWRNYVIFGRSSDIPIDVGRFLHTRFEETWRILGDDIMGSTNTHQHRQEILVSWEFPPHSWFALNTDGAARGCPGPAGGGGLIRDHLGTLHYAFSANYGHCSAFRAELKAVEMGLELAIRMGISKVMLQMDNQAAILALQGSDDYGGECAHIVQHCRNLIINNSWEVLLRHVYREGNRAADWLANVGVMQNSRMELIQVPPLELGRILHEDLMGVARPRLVAST